jgi:hypothetical protein
MRPGFLNQHGQCAAIAQIAKGSAVDLGAFHQNLEAANADYPAVEAGVAAPLAF